MSRSSVYDLGDVSPGASQLDPRPARDAPQTGGPANPVGPSVHGQAVGHFEHRREPARADNRTTGRRSLGWSTAASLSLFVPGAGQFARGDRTLGLFFLCSMGFLVALGWAASSLLDGLVRLLDVFALPRQTAFATFGLIYTAACALHLASVLHTDLPASTSRSMNRHPLVAGAASILVPGWGQILNGDRARATLVLGSVWVLGAGWLMLSPGVSSLLHSIELFLPSWAGSQTVNTALWAGSAVVYSLAVYDAAASAAHRR